MRTAISPALLAPVEQRWLEKAASEFDAGKDVIYFATDSKRVGPAMRAKPSRVYFKPIGFNEVRARAECVEVTKQNIPTKRLRGNERLVGLFYYGFKNLVWLTEPLPVSTLRYYSTNNVLRNDATACLIVEPEG